MQLIQNFSILGGDRRQFYLAQQLMRAGFSVACHQVPGLDDTHAGLHDALQQAEAVILPMPALLDGGHIRSAQPLPVEAVRQSLPRGTRVFGGLLPEGLFPEHIQYDYAHDGSLAVQNAALTAEGALALALTELPCALSGNSVLVIGFGRIGTFLAEKLQRLGASVTTACRKQADLGRASACGYASVRTGRYERGLSQYDCIFNTVPAPVFTPAQLEQLCCPVFDLASAPGGLPEDTPAPEFWHPAPGLPGRFAPESAARILKETILRTLSEEQEALWNP